MPGAETPAPRGTVHLRRGYKGPKAVNLPTLAVRSRPQRHDHLKGQFEHWAFGEVLLHMRTVGDPLSPHPLLSSRYSQVPNQCSPCILEQAHA